MGSSHRYRAQAAHAPGSILLETTRTVPGRPARSLFFSQPVAWLEARRLSEIPALFRHLEDARSKGLWAAGFLGYECGYGWEPKAASGFVASADGLPLAAFGLYREPVACTPPDAAAGATVENSALAIAPAAFAAKIAAIHRWIEAGDTYQANLTDRIHAQFAGDPAALYAQMMTAQPVEFGALLRIGDRTILSASPELFFRLQGRAITVRPMKGTAPRGRDAAEDAARARALHDDPKNRAENLMIVDLMRNDLGRVAVTGSVRVAELFAVEQFPSLLQMSSEITATLRPEVTLQQLFTSLFPCGSIVGAPKVRTMQILRELEGRERGVYTGTIGYVAPNGDATFSVAIRTAVLHGEQLEMGVGAGITYDSDSAAEYAECVLKGAFLAEAPFRLIETMRWEDGACALLSAHMERMGASAAYFGFACDRAKIEARLTEAARALAPGAWKLRCELDRSGRLHLSPPEPVLPDVAPVTAMLWPEPVDSEDRFLRHKTTRRALYTRAYAAAQACGCADALFVNERGELTEGAIHSIVVRHGAAWRTPPLDAGVLPGVYRRHLLATMPALREATLVATDLRTADAVWLTNAVRGVRVMERRLLRAAVRSEALE